MKKLWCYDLEVFKNLFLLGFRCPRTGETRIFEISSRKNNAISARRFLKNEVSSLVGFNTTSYDSILLDFFMKTTISANNKFYQLSQRAIQGYSGINNNPLIPHLDLYKVLHFDNPNKRTSLKYCEFGLKMPVVQDLPYPFDKELSFKQIKNVVDYLHYDLDATEALYKQYLDKVYLRQVFQKEYGLRCRNWSDSKIGEKLLLHFYCKETGESPEIVNAQRTNMFNLDLNTVLSDYLEFKNPIFQDVYQQIKDTTLTPDSWKLKIKFEFNDIKYVVGLGGIHSSDKGIWKASEDLLIDDRDVSGYYPSLIINLGICPQHLDTKAFAKVIKDKLVTPRAKIHKPKSKDKTLHWKERKLHAAFSDGLKLAANSISGKLKDMHSFCYSPDQNAKMTLNGQLSLLMLIDMIWQEIPDIHILQSNTDGFTMTYHPSKKPIVDKICKKWEKITNLDLEDAYPKAVYQRDVNNYIWDFGDYQKLKGAYEIEKKVGNELQLHKDSSMSIIPIAVKEYFVNGTPVEETIKNHNNIYDFCIGKKASSSPKRGKQMFKYQHNPNSGLVPLRNVKTLRYYVSTKGGIIWKTYKNGTKEYLEAYPGKKDGKYWKLRLFNRYKEKENYEIDYDYYIYKANKIIKPIEQALQK